VRAGHRRRNLRRRGLERRDPGRGLQADRQARLPDGPDPPSFRASRLVRADGRDPLLDHQLRACAGGSQHAQAPVITARAFAGKHYAVLGLARSGAATVRALLASGAKVIAWDDKAEARSGAPKGLDLVDFVDSDLSQFDSIVVTPGLPLNRHPIAH